MTKLKKIFNKNNILSSIIIFVTIALMAFIVYFKLVPFTEAIDENNVAQKDIYAPYDYYDEKRTLELAQEKAAQMEPILVTRHDATFAAFEDVAVFFDETDTYRIEVSQYDGKPEMFNSFLSNKITSYINMCLKKNILTKHNIVKKLIVGLSNAEYENFKSAVTSNFSYMQNTSVFAGNRGDFLDEFAVKMKREVMDEELADIGIKIANSFLRINSIVNEEDTAIAREQIRETEIRENPIIIKEGQLILASGKTADENTVRLLIDLDMTGEKKFNETLFIGLLGLILFLFIPIMIFKIQLEKKYSKRHILVMCSLQLMLFVLIFFMPRDLKYYIPVFFVPMLTAILVDEKIAIMIGMITAVLLSFVYKSDPTYLAILVGGSVVSAYLANKIHERMKLLASGLAIGLTTSIILLFSTMATNGGIKDVWFDIVILMLNGMVSVILVIGLLPLFETVFNIITPFKLLELANPNRPLLKRLLVEAPGTYHHSLMVGNLAEEAANEIGANGLLARVGAYYHDVGKISRPMFYAENQSCEDNPHDRMKPEMSKLIITSHTSEGNDIAKKYKLPSVIRDFIKEHHGTTQVKYFYNKALEENGENINPDDYRYSGPKPKSKETAVVMLADSVEAILRSKGEVDREKMEIIIRKSIKDKLDDGQFDLCDLTLKDFDGILNAFMRVFGGYFHKRIDYPDAPNMAEVDVE